MLISEEYRKLNTQLHETKKGFGGRGWKKAHLIYDELVIPYQIETILDYGCGKATLGKLFAAEFNMFIDNYDPAMPLYATHPPVGKQYDGVVCSDVLEHVEPEFLDNVLQDVYNLGKTAFYLEAGVTKSNKYLADGRNNHLTVQPSTWWRNKFEEHGFVIQKVLRDFADHEALLGDYGVVCTKRNTDSAQLQLL